MSRYREKKGFSLVELMVSTVIFMIAVALMYPTFSFMTEQADYISDKEALYERGQRILDYLTQDLSTAGFVVGATTGIPYCSTTDVDVIQHTNGEPNDQLTYITSKPLEIRLIEGCITPGSTTPCVNNDYYLNVCAKAQIGDVSLAVDAPLSCVEGISPDVHTIHSGRSIIAFEKASQIKTVYQVFFFSYFSSNPVILIRNSAPFTPLLLEVPDNSIVYTVRQYRYSVDGMDDDSPRTLKRVGRKSNCNDDPVDIDEAFGPNGGIDAMQFQFIYDDPVSGTQFIVDTLAEVNDIKDLRAIRVILLLRSERPDRNHTNDNLYDLGGTIDPPLQFNDSYRRVVLSKTVEVKSVAF